MENSSVFVLKWPWTAYKPGHNRFFVVRYQDWFLLPILEQGLTEAGILPLTQIQHFRTYSVNEDYHLCPCFAIMRASLAMTSFVFAPAVISGAQFGVSRLMLWLPSKISIQCALELRSIARNKSMISVMIGDWNVLSRYKNGYQTTWKERQMERGCWRLVLQYPLGDTFYMIRRIRKQWTKEHTNLVTVDQSTINLSPYHCVAFCYRYSKQMQVLSRSHAIEFRCKEI